MANSIQELFNVSDQLAKNLDIPHKLAVPKISKIVIHQNLLRIPGRSGAMSMSCLKPGSPSGLVSDRGRTRHSGDSHYA